MMWFRQLVIFIALLASGGLGAGGAVARDLGQTNIAQAVHATNMSGIPQLTVEGVGTVSHPAWTALYALAYGGVEDYDPALGLKPDKERFNTAIDWLKANLVQDRHGHWVWIYHFDNTYNDITIHAPWSSAFAQAVGVQALLAHWKKSGDSTSLELARRASESLFIPIHEGGFLFRSGEDIWFEEIPLPAENPSHILNGHMRALLAIRELAEATDEQSYQDWFERGSETLLKWLPLYDAGYWLRYDLNPRKSELLFRLTNPYGFANPELAIDRITLRDPLTGEESVLDVGAANDAEGPIRIAGNDWGHIEEVDGRSVRRLRPVEAGREDFGSEGQFVSPYSYFYLKLPGEWKNNLRIAPYELRVEYFDEHPGNLEIQMRSIAPGRSTFKTLRDSELLISGKGAWRNWKVKVYPSDLGYWVGMSYGQKHSEYLELLSNYDNRFKDWSDLSQAYVNSLVSHTAFEAVKPERTLLPVQTPPLPGVYSLDDNGVLLMHMPREGSDAEDKIGVPVYSPYIIASQAIDGPNMAGLQEILRPMGIDKSRVKSSSALRWLLNRANYKDLGGAVVYPYDFDNVYNDVVTRRPWPSSFAQNYILKALEYSYFHSPNNKEEIKSVLEGVIRSYALNVSDGGILFTDRAGGYFFEEVPNGTHILNGHLSSIPMLYDASKISEPDLAQEIIDKGLLALRRNLYLFDTGYWLRYDLNPKKELLFQLDLLSGDRGPLIERITLVAPQFSKKTVLDVGSKEGPNRIGGIEWLSAEKVDGRSVRSFENGYLKRNDAVQGGAHHNVFAVMHLPEKRISNYFDLQPHQLVIRYKDVSKGKFLVKIQSVNEGNRLHFVPLRNSVINMIGDNRWKDVAIEVRPQDMGWFKGIDYQQFEVGQIERIANITKDWFFEQYAERHKHYLDAKREERDVIIQPHLGSYDGPIGLRVADASPTYLGFGFDNALDGDPNNDYVAGLEGVKNQYVELILARPIYKGILRIKWESLENFSKQVRVFSIAKEGKVELASIDNSFGDDVDLIINSDRLVGKIRLEFEKNHGQPRVLLRTIELTALSEGPN